VATRDMGRKEGGCCAPFAGELGPRLTQCGLGRGLLPYKVASSSIQPFGHNRHEPKTGAVPLLGGGSCNTIKHNIAWAEVYLRTKWHLDASSRLATIGMGQKLDGDCAFFSGGVGSLSNTKSPGLRPTSIPSGILVHPTNVVSGDRDFKFGR